MSKPPYIVGLGGTTRPNSSSESAMRIILDRIELLGGRTQAFGGDSLATLPLYEPGRPERTQVAKDLIGALRQASGVIISSPGYHGSVSGLVKNALDYVEDMRDDARPYLTGRAVGLVSTAHGGQASVTTLSSLRSIVHALRGWPTPLGAAVNSSRVGFHSHGNCDDTLTLDRLHVVADEVLKFACMTSSYPSYQTTGGPS